MHNCTLIIGSSNRRLTAIYQALNLGNNNPRSLYLQSPAGLKAVKSASFFALRHRQNPMKTLFTKNIKCSSPYILKRQKTKSLKTDFLQNAFCLFMGLHTLTLDLLLKRLFTTSSTSNDFNNTATIWKLNAVKRRVI
jgi:hypothetical protein